MRIANRMTRHPRYNAGGAQRQMELIGRYLAKMGIEYSYITKKNTKNQNIHEVLGNFSFHAILGRKFFNKELSLFDKIHKLYYSYELIVFLRYFRFLNHDIYHLRGAKAIVGIWAFFIKYIKRKKFVFTAAHIKNCIPESYSMREYSYKLYEYGLKKADLIIVLAHYMKEALIENYNLKSIVIKPGHPIPKPPFKKADPPMILWISRLVKFKRPQIFLTIANTLKHLKVQFVLIGDGNCKKEEIINYAKQNDSFIYIPYVPMSRDNYYYQKASLLINTSVNEGFPNSFIQAWLHETPVISLDVDPDNEICLNNLGYYAQGNLMNLVKKVHDLITHPEEIKSIGKKCRDHAINHYNIKNTSEKHLKAYQWLLKQD